MSGFIRHDLYCSRCEEHTLLVMYRRSEGIPLCPRCGEPRTVSWASGVAPRIHSFTPLDCGDGRVFHTQDALNRYTAEMEELHPGKHVVVEGDTQAKRNQLSDEAHHRAYAKLRARGLSEKQLADHDKHVQATKTAAAHEAERKNLNPKPVGDAAARACGSAAAAYGVVK